MATIYSHQLNLVSIPQRILFAMHFLVSQKVKKAGLILQFVHQLRKIQKFIITVIAVQRCSFKSGLGDYIYL